MADIFDVLSKIFGQYGLGAVFGVAMLYICYKLVSSVLAKADAREIKYQAIIDNQNAALNKHTDALNEHTTQAREFHAVTNATLKGICESLGRINGYK